MPKWTIEQQQAIEVEGTSVLVSAGAGSGKTAVLTSRVIRKLKEGVSLDQLLLLTFTKAAAAEMKERIRSSIQKEPLIHDQLEKVDSAYITTFDSYALSIVKRYHYVLNVSREIGIVEPTLVTLQKQEIIDQLFLERYQEKEKCFLQLIHHFCLKDDQELKKSILTMFQKLELLEQKEAYLDHYLERYDNSLLIDQYLSEYLALIQEKVEEIPGLIDCLEDQTGTEYAVKVRASLGGVLKSSTYDDWKQALFVKLPPLPRGSSEEAKQTKEKLMSLIKELQLKMSYDSTEQIKEEWLSTRGTVEAIVPILRQLNTRLFQWKQRIGQYEFHDIAFLAIALVRDHPEIALEIKQSLNEIMIDEYQDTNDIQETFLSYISNHNVYMVGDIKQSIYRFRNANPNLFKEKYQLYQSSNEGMKIDLNKNFRSRREVLDDINAIFAPIMDAELGGANYREGHEMIFGNTSYEEEPTLVSNHMNFLNYERAKGCPYSKDEIEIFTIARDIQEKIMQSYPVRDAKTGHLRPVQYQDIVILMDRSTKFDLYKKIFEYLGVPLTILKDETIRQGYDLAILTNLLSLIQKVRNQDYDAEFEYDFLSVGRSYLYRMEDEVLFRAIKEHQILKTDLLKQVKELADQMDHLACFELLELVYQNFSFYEKLITTATIDESLIRFDYLMDLARSLASTGYDCYAFIDYMKSLREMDLDMRYTLNTNSGNTVKIMTIHKSKGLEYPLCYFSGLSSDFNMSDLKERFLFHETYGFLVPLSQEGIRFTIVKELLKHRYQMEEISEKIRLFYVALTRSKEKLIFVTSMKQNDREMSSSVLKETKLRYRSFQDLLDSIASSLEPYIKPITIEELGITKQYRFGKEVVLEKETSEELFEVKNLTFPVEEQNETHYAKEMHHLVTKKEMDNIALGLRVHEILQWLDFEHPDWTGVDPFLRTKLEAFLHTPLFEQPILESYQEQEFRTETSHGIIDLILEYEDYYLIVDYKLKHLNEEAYLKQVKGYREFLQTKVSKPVKVCLYSILEETIQEIEE